MTNFNKLYQHYKNDFDTEMSLKKAGMTYAVLQAKTLKSEEWI